MTQIDPRCTARFNDDTWQQATIRKTISAVSCRAVRRVCLGAADAAEDHEQVDLGCSEEAYARAKVLNRDTGGIVARVRALAERVHDGLPSRAWRHAHHAAPREYA